VIWTQLAEVGVHYQASPFHFRLLCWCF